MADDGRPKRSGLLTLVLLGVGIAAVMAAIAYRYRYNVIAIAPTQAQSSQQSAFDGASKQRVFLSNDERAEAVRRGLLPKGTRSIIATAGPLQYGQWRWDEQGVPQGQITVHINLRRQLVSVFRGADEIGTAVVVYGIDGKASPVGKLPILRKVRDYHSITYDAPMPFSLFIRNDGVAVHGSPIAADKATNGCIGLPLGFAEKLFEVANVGDIIEIREGD